MEENKEKILFYEQEFYMFSNFSSFMVQYKGVLWPTSEYAYQAAKFTDPLVIIKIKEARSAYEVYRIAKENVNLERTDWKDIKIKVMEEIVKSKLMQHPHIQEKLKKTGTKEIVENSPTDSFWGWGPNKDGENNLGKIWMKLRDEI